MSTKSAANKPEVQANKPAGITILEALDRAKSGAAVRRRGWSDERMELIFKPAESKPQYLRFGKYTSPYIPSIEDVMAHDWIVSKERADD